MSEKRNLVIFAGTTEGRTLSEALCRAGIAHTVCVATDYGEDVMKENGLSPHVTLKKGRLDENAMLAFLKDGGFGLVVDATHPYAAVVTQNIRSAAAAAEVPYIRFLRDMDGGTTAGAAGEDADAPVFRDFPDTASCAAALCETEGMILLTTGSKELPVFAEHEELKNRIIARVLPGTESIKICEDAGVPGKQIVAMQGPFSEDMNRALIRAFSVRILVTKVTGRTGGYGEKIAAAKKEGAEVWRIGRPAAEQGFTFKETLQKIAEILDVQVSAEPICTAEPEAEYAEAPAHADNKENGSGVRFEITLAGIGMGDEGSMTVACRNAIENADYLFGAERMIAPYSPRIEKKPFYLAKDILPYLIEVQNGSTCASEGEKTLRAAVLFSGDSGFFSGCTKMYRALCEAAENGELRASVRILPGISSISSIAAKTGIPYGDAAILSLHGKSGWERELADAVRTHRYSFMLTSGKEDFERIAAVLSGSGIPDAEITYAYAMGSADERTGTVKAAAFLEDPAPEIPQGLYTCIIENPEPESFVYPLTHGLPDTAFIRGKVPMTKEEVRGACISKLRLAEGAVAWDVGAGTGSVAIEIARLKGTAVYAIEQNPDGIALIHENARALGASDLTVVEGKAPEALEDLPAPTHVFIGGSSGGMKEILSLIYEKNPRARVVITAVTAETIAEMTQLMKEFPMEDDEIVQLQAARSRKAGRYHLMTAENPIWIGSFTFAKEDEG